MSERRVLVARRPAAVARAGRGAFTPSAGTARDAETRVVMRRQLSVAAVTLAMALGVLAGVPVLAAGVGDAWWWVAASVGVQPLWVLLAVLQLRGAERAERAGR
ncbi:hypothetical protein [Nonomuraea typhae]|uniref:hypothetical protein n=1 Tax=Nonomuraea typhae TaxID=2603600 RepID=UPI0012F96AA2|nr:hypothetical protein [Nonomuraea typhae]